MPATKSQPSPRILRNRKKKRERIVQRAMQTLAEQGPQAFSLHQLARDLDVTVGAIYRYFSSKDLLLAEVQARFVARLHRYIEESIALIPEAPAPERSLAAILVAGRAYETLPQVMPAAFGLISQALALPERVVSDEADQPVQDRMRETLGWLAGVIEEAVRCQALQPAPTAARAVHLWCCSHGAAQIAKVNFAPEFVDGDSRIVEILRALLIGWGATDEAIDAAEELVAKVPRPPEA